MIRRPPRSTQSRSSAASDVYKRQFSRLKYEKNQDNQDDPPVLFEKRQQHTCTPFRNLQQSHDTTYAPQAACWKRLARRIIWGRPAMSRVRGDGKISCQISRHGHHAAAVSKMEMVQTEK